MLSKGGLFAGPLYCIVGDEYWELSGIREAKTTTIILASDIFMACVYCASSHFLLSFANLSLLSPISYYSSTLPFLPTFLSYILSYYSL